MSETRNGTVMVIDDDWAVREALSSLLRSAGYDAEIYASLDEFRARGRLPDNECCLIFDVRLPGINGLDFQADLAKSKVSLPIIFITGHGDVPMSVRAMKGGAVEFLTKPFRDEDLLTAIHIALEQDCRKREEGRWLSKMMLRYGLLSTREQEVMSQVVSGLMNKQIATNLGISEITVKAHRGQVMRKMEAQSVVELARMSDRLGLPEFKPPPGPGAVFNDLSE